MSDIDEAAQNEESVEGLFIDPKADSELPRKLLDMTRRGELLAIERKRRGVKFLPKQVMRPLYAKNGLDDGIALKPNGNYFSF